MEKSKKKSYDFNVRIMPKKSVKKQMYASQDDGNNCRSNGGRGQTSSQ